MTDSWISAETEQKERDYAGLLDMHVRICKGILARHDGPPYLYVDCHAGPGDLQFQGRRFLGSPLIFRQVASHQTIDHVAVHFEQNQSVAARLTAALDEPVSLFDRPEAERSEVRVATCEHGVPTWLDEFRADPRQLGLVYSDPIGKDIPAELLATVGRKLPKVDILSYVSGTAYKRRNGIKPGIRLAEHVATIQRAGKPHVLIREPATAWQWTFILWTAWTNFPEWEKRGFHSIATPAGQRILDKLNYTAAERHERGNTPLWEEGDDAVLRTTATR